MGAEELIGIDVKAYVTKDTLEAIKHELKYHGHLSTHIISSSKEIKIVWIEEK